VGSVAAVPPDSALGVPRCRDYSQASEDPDTVPWAQQWLAPERAWPLSRAGAGVRVAVVGSGVNRSAHLGDRLERGRDLLDPTGDGRTDCAGHGTGVATVVAGASRPRIGFVGVAPGARIVPIRITDTETPDNSDPTRLTVPPALMAAGIDAAVASGARVMVVSLVLPFDEVTRDAGGRPVGRVQAAVRRAVARDVVVVAAVGDGHQLEPDPKEPPSVPADYPGVIGVGSIDQRGERVATSQVGPYVDLVAPGGGVLVANRSDAYNTVSGTSFAAAHVAGVAALVRAAAPQLRAPEVAARLLASASPARGGTGSAEYGRGVVDPYAAVTATVAPGPPRSPTPVTSPTEDPAAVAAAERASRVDAAAMAAGAAALGLVCLVAVLAVVLPRARRRRWTAARSAAARADPEVDEPSAVFYTPPGLRTRR